jgi:hypothetical protein
MSENPAKKSMIRQAVGYFMLVLGGSLVAAVIGGGFGALVAAVSPEFVSNLFFLDEEDGSVVRYAFSIGMLWGLFLGLGVSCFACVLTAIVKIIRLRVEHRSGSKG